MLGHIFYRPAIVQTVSQLYKNYSYVIIECQKDALEILRLNAFLLGLVLIVEHGFDLGKAIHKRGDLVSEKIPYVIDSVVGIFNHIMQQSRNN